jgi:hypothetical protein
MTDDERIKLQAKLMDLIVEREDNRSKIPPNFLHYLAVWKRNERLAIEITEVRDKLAGL